MSSWRLALGLGVAMWIIPFVVAVVVFPFRESTRPLFESIMAVAVTATAVGLGLVYLRRFRAGGIREGLLLGLIWLVISLAIDLPLFLLASPMQMTLGAYLADIGLTYVSIPVVTWGLARARV